jgi:hypothetical protein
MTVGYSDVPTNSPSANTPQMQLYKQNGGQTTIVQKAKGKLRVWGPRVLVVGAVGLSLTGILAFKIIFPHSGEKVLDLVPDSAVFAGTLDLDPAPSQILTFMKIGSAMKRNGFSNSIKSAAQNMNGQIPGLDSILKISTHSVSVCGFADPKKKDQVKVAFLAPFTDSEKARQILDQQGQFGVYGGTQCYRLTKPSAYAMIEGATLIVGQEPWVLAEMAKVPNGQAAPITKAPGYLEARAKEPSDATVLVMVSPKIAALSSQAVKNAELGWFSFSLTVQSGGLAASSHGKYNPTLSPAMATLASAKPLRPDLLQVLPAGAYGLYAISQPGKCVATALASVAKAPVATRKALLKEEDQLRKEEGLDLQNDIVQGIEGDIVYGLYPSEQPTAGFDFLMVADNSNGADPTNLARKLQSTIDRMINKPNKKRDDWYVSVPRAQGTEFQLSPVLNKDIADWKKMDPSGAVRMSLLTDGKTVAWASVGKTVFLSTSLKLLDRAVVSYGGQNQTSLVSDPLLSPDLDTGHNDQTFAVASLSRIAQGLRNSTNESKMSPETRAHFDRMVGMLDHLTTPVQFQVAQSADGEIIGSAFLPVDCENLIDFIGAMEKKSSSPSDNKSGFKA